MTRRIDVKRGDIIVFDSPETLACGSCVHTFRGGSISVMTGDVALVLNRESTRYDIRFIDMLVKGIVCHAIKNDINDWHTVIHAEKR